MDKEILKQLELFLPDYVIQEICQTYGIDYEEEQQINNTNKEKQSENNETEAENENEDGNKNETKIENENNNGNKNNEMEVKNENEDGNKNENEDGNKNENEDGNKNETKIENENNNEDTFSLLENYDLKEFSVTSTKENYIGFLERDNISTFVFPVSVNKLEQIKKLYEELKKYASGNDENKFFLLTNTSDNDMNDFKGQKEYVENILILTKKFLNSGGRQIQTKNITYNNYKLERILPIFLKNPKFYKQFLIKEKIFVPTLTISIDNPKTRFLKYYLQKTVSKISNKNIQNKLYWVINVLLKDVKSEKTNIKVSQYRDLQAIIFYLTKLLQGEIKLLKYLIDKINDLYEVWLYVKIVKYFSNNWEEELEEKVYKSIILENNEITTDLENKIYANGKTIYFKENGESKLLTNFFMNLDRQIYYSYSQKEKFQLLIIIRNILIKKILKDEKLGLDDFKKALGIGTKIKGKNINNIISLFNNTKRKIKLYLSNNNSFYSFIKEDLPEFKGLSTIKLDKLSKKIKLITKNKTFFNETPIDYYLSLGGYIPGEDGENYNLNNKLLSKELAQQIKKTSQELEDLIKHDKITPDFILEIKQKNKLIGKIFFDAKFSKYPFFEEGKLDLEKIDYTPVIKYYQELGKYFSTIEKGNDLPYKVIILFPGGKKHGEVLKNINNLFERMTNIVAVPLMTGEEKNIEENMELLKKYIYNFTKEILFK